jgi:hypothetical protein
VNQKDLVPTPSSRLKVQSQRISHPTVRVLSPIIFFITCLRPQILFSQSNTSFEIVAQKNVPCQSLYSEKYMSSHDSCSTSPFISGLGGLLLVWSFRLLDLMTGYVGHHAAILLGHLALPAGRVLAYLCLRRFSPGLSCIHI